MTDDARARRLLCAIYPTWYERALGWVVTNAYRRGEHGLFGWIGDRADDLRCWSQKRRAT